MKIKTLILITWLINGLATTLLVMSANAQTPAVKLWPQITPGIYNHANVLAMKCEVAIDGLTVTDEAWDSYQVDGCAKRWTLNMGLPMNVPLKKYAFPTEFSGLPVNLTVEFYNPDKPWEVKENYQEILLLGGKQCIGLPDWFHTPNNRLGYDFDEGNWFPSGWTLPHGKYAIWQGATKARQKDIHGECPMYCFGFTHVSPIAMTHGGLPGTRERRAHLFTDNEWVSGVGAETKDPKNWQIGPFHHYADTCAIITPDFEAPDYLTWKDYQYDAFAKIIGEVRAGHPDLLIGCWGIGVLGSSFRIFDSRWDGKPTGVVDLNAAKQWREKYNNPDADMNPVFKRCNLNFGNPSVYWINNSKPSQLYAIVQEWEQGKLARPQTPNILSSWIQVEFVDGYPLSQYRFTDANGKTRREDIKHQVPASTTYALSLFGHCVMDGLQCWDIGTRYSEELQDYSDWRIQEPIVKRTINGIETWVNYYIKYFGFYNFHVLGMWQASQNKDIIDGNTAWEMPELITSKNNVWRTGDERYPSYVSYYKEPLIRTKLSTDGKTLLVVACNPYNTGVEHVRIRRTGNTEQYVFQLVGDFPIIKRFPVINATAEKNTYYVSQSIGNDRNDGTESSPWQTLTKVSGITFNAGDSVLLKCGDTWTGETLYLHASGASSSNWVTLASYGNTSAGKPKILPGSSFDWAIKIENVANADRNCGWKIKDLEIGNAKMGIAFMDYRTTGLQLDGFWVENCYLHDIKGLVQEQDSMRPYSTAIYKYAATGPCAKYLTIKDVIIENCTVGIDIRWIWSFLIQNVHTNHTGLSALNLVTAINGSITDCIFLNAGEDGYRLGTCAVGFMHTVKDVTLKDSEIAGTKSPNSVDGCAVDYEGASTNVTTTNCNIHDNAGRAFLIMSTGGDCSNSTITNNTCVNNGWDSAPEIEPAFLLVFGNKDNRGTISGNKITKSYLGQSLNRLDLNYTETYPVGFTCFNNMITTDAPQISNTDIIP